jgi:copper transport protein
MRRRCRRAVLLAVVLILLLPAPVLAHAVLLRSDPVEGSILIRPPSAIELWFSEPVEALVHGITVIAPSGRHVERGPVRVSGAEMSISVAAAEQGTYVVLWRVISGDTHPSSGQFTFSLVRRSGAASPAADAMSVALALAIQALARWLHFIGYALGFGSLAFLLALRRLAGGERDAVVERAVWRLVGTGIAILLLAEAPALIGQIAGLEPGTFFDSELAGAALASSFGRALAQRLGAAILLWVLAGAARAGADRAVAIAAGLGVVLAGIDGEASHAVSLDPPWPALAADAVHVAAMGLWLGGLVALVLVAGFIDSATERRRLVAAFGRLAAACAALLLLSGALMAVLYLKVPSNLLGTGYGRTLLAKSALVPVVLLLALAGRRVHPAKQGRWWMIELAVLLVVLALAGLLVSQPTPL